MNTVDYDQAALFEHRFWLQILGDHARFLFRSLSPAEVEAVSTAHHFIHVFDQLLETARHDLDHGEILQLNQQACWHPLPAHAGSYGAGRMLLSL